MSVENTRNSILSIAKVYLGYQEGYNNDNIFGDWYGMPNQPWCTMFVSYCMSKAGVSQDVVKKFASCTIGWNWFAARGETRDKNFVPQRERLEIKTLFLKEEILYFLTGIQKLEMV